LGTQICDNRAVLAFGALLRDRDIGLLVVEQHVVREALLLELAHCDLRTHEAAPFRQLRDQPA
jgi:hypothetical protein